VMNTDEIVCLVLLALLAVVLPALCWLRSLLPFLKAGGLKQALASSESGTSTQGGGVADVPNPSVLPSRLDFRNVRYTVDTPGGPLAILKGVSGFLAPGTLTAIMGPSGCGKSTLLDILADAKEVGRVQGDILLNGTPRTADFRSAAAYVMQDDNTHTCLTVRETFWFVCEMRLPPSVSKKQRLARVQETLRDIDLEHVADTRIGDDVSGGLSGGQRRRVTIGIELINRPSLLLLDEPTSGLDAYGALQVVTSLRRFADRGQTLACTIHQPRADTFGLFDKLLLMYLGETMYFGPITSIYDHFEGCGVSVQRDLNPADFIVDL